MPEQLRGKSFTILLIEDSDEDLFLYQRAMRKNKLENPLHRVRNGDEAIAYLEGRGQYADRNTFAFPSLIVTDLAMPRKSGVDFLRWMKEHPKYRVIPTVMISNSGDDNDIWNAYQAGVDAYMIKPSDTENLVRKLGLIFQYWAECEIPVRRLESDSAQSVF